MVLDCILADDPLAKALVVVLGQPEQNTVVILYASVETPPRLGSIATTDNPTCGANQRNCRPLIVASAMELNCSLAIPRHQETPLKLHSIVESFDLVENKLHFFVIRDQFDF